MPTGSITDCQRFCDAIVAAHGRVPEQLERLLSIAELLMAPGAVSDPLKPVLDAAMQGQLDQRKLDKMLVDAATQTQIAAYKQDLRSRAERAVTQRFHKALRDGCADLVLNSLRDAFTEHAQAIARTRAVISADSELEHIVASAQPGDDTITLWQQLPVHLAAVSKVGAVAAQLGARPTAQFPLITEHPGDNRATDDRALYCCNGPGLEGDSRPFVQWGPGQERRRSPWYRVPLQLNTVAQAAERYRQWCENQWEARRIPTRSSSSPGWKTAVSAKQPL